MMVIKLHNCIVCGKVIPRKGACESRKRYESIQCCRPLPGEKVSACRKSLIEARQKAMGPPKCHKCGGVVPRPEWAKKYSEWVRIKYCPGCISSRRKVVAVASGAASRAALAAIRAPAGTVIAGDMGRLLTAEEIDKIRHTITPIEEIPLEVTEWMLHPGVNNKGYLYPDS